MSRRRWLSLAVAGAGATAAAAATGVVVERRVIRTRRQASGRADELGALRSDPVTVTTDDGLSLHAEVDPVAPYGEGSGLAGRTPERSAKRGRRSAPPSVVTPTLVFVHGYALNLDCWHFQRQRFRGKYDLVFYDQRSHGRSERSDPAHATIEQLGEDLRAVLEQLVPEGPVVLIGHSMGGMSVMAFADACPELFAERVIGVGLISTSAGGLRPHRTLSRLIPDLVGKPVAPRLIAGVAALGWAPQLIDTARRRGTNVGFLIAERFAFGEEVPAGYVEFIDRMLADTPFEVVAQFFPIFASLDKYAALRAFSRVPTTIVCGTKDVLTSIGHSRKMASQVTGSRLVECEGAGHMVILESHDAVNDALDDLVDRAVAAPHGDREASGS